VAPLTLVVLAAGLGSRFGGTKQIAAVGPHGEAIVDYTIADALRAGFSELVLVVRTDIVDLVTDHLRAVHGPALRYRLVHQDTFGPARPKPWGTGHAVLTASEAVSGPFAVVNADDFYGRDGLATVGAALAAETDPHRHHLVGYRLGATLSSRGQVSRGVCDVGPDGELRDIVEHFAIERRADGTIGHRGEGTLAPERLVSMNLWGLQPSIFDELERRWADFRAGPADDPGAEFMFPAVVNDLVARGGASVAVHATDAPWLGVTYAGDLDEVRARIAGLVGDGIYPSPLTTG
jgi:UTP-glucose-1-phosphate uridylyltransferase